MRQLTKTPELTAASGKVQIIIDWLNENYDLKVNIFDRTKSSIASKSRKYLNSISENDIYIHMLDEGITCSKSLLKTIMSSPNQIRSYNPIVEYFEGLEGKWKGESMIDLLCSSVHAHDFLDHEETYYQNRARYLIKKWLVASVACVFGKSPNDVALGIVNAMGGIGKTTLIENLVPKELEDFYVVSNRDERLFKMTDCFANKFIINFDEFVGLTRATEPTFKTNMSRQNIDIRFPGEQFISNVPRIASCAFTSNKTKEQGGFLFNSDSGMLRRLAIIEIDDINDYRKDFDVDQLWAEALTLFHSDFRFIFDKNDYKDFIEYNMKYVVETSAFKLIKEWYRKPCEDEEYQFKMPMDIVRDLRHAHKANNTNYNLDEITVGQALTQLGFERTAKKIPGIGTRYGYRVIPLY